MNGSPVSSIRAARVTQGLTLRDVSKATSIYPSRLSRLERAIIRPYKREAQALAQFFDIPASVLFPDGAGKRE
jgi:transcriptional regulator with XRE-family HTH domain